MVYSDRSRSGGPENQHMKNPPGTPSTSASSRQVLRASVAALALATATVLTGCAATNPATYDSFSQWAVGDIDVYRLDAGAEHRPQVYRMLYGLALTPPLATYDAARIAASPVVWSYYAAGDVPNLFRRDGKKSVSTDESDWRASAFESR